MGSSTMPTPEQYALAVLGALSFGVIVASWFHSSWQRLLLLLVVLWTLQTAPQYILRWLDGQSVTQEIINVTLLRTTFTTVAVITVWAWNRWREAKDV